MRYIIYYCLILIIFGGCSKESSSKVDIYLLKSFTTSIDRTTSPAAVTISNAILDTILVTDNDIESYTSSTTTFKLKKDIQSVVKNYGVDKGFAVTVDDQPVYYGVFHPGYLSSITFGVAQIDPLLGSRELTIRFPTMVGSSDLLRLDKRNDARILKSLKKSRRLR